MNKFTILPLLLAAMLLQACGNSGNASVADNKPLANFLSLYSQYCDSGYKSADELVSALQKDPSFRASDNYDGIFEKSIGNLSYAISPEEDGCTTDLKLKVSASGKAYFGFEEINKALLSKGYRLKGDKAIRTEVGLDNQDLKVIEQQYITKDNSVSTLVFPLEHEDQYYMTLFVEKFDTQIQDVSISSDDPSLVEI